MNSELIKTRAVTARLWSKKSSGSDIVCNLCCHSCHISPGNRGRCQVRINLEGQLKTLNYGFPGAIALDPVEKKPLYHFLPGTMTLSMGAPGCNFTCRGCQNHALSCPGNEYDGFTGEPINAQVLVSLAQERKAKSISFTYSEPTVFYEYAQDVAIEASSKSLLCVWVSNGFMSKKVLDSLLNIGAMNLDLKSFNDDFYKTVSGAGLSPVLDNISRVLERGIWLEVTTLVIPGLNDSDLELKAMAKYLASLSRDLPWHLSRFVPHHLQRHISVTPVGTLERAREIGYESGLRYIYLGNVSGKSYADTVCPGCHSVLIERDGFSVRKNSVTTQGTCPKCQEVIAGFWL